MSPLDIAPVLLLSVLALACTTSNATSAMDAGPDSAARAWSSSTCGMCVLQQCSTPTSECAADASCSAYLSCLEACPVGAGGDADPACEATCAVPPGNAAAQGFVQCRANGAAVGCAACSPGDGGSAFDASAILNESCAPSAATDPCAKCEAEKCCETHDAFFGSSDGIPFASCVTACDADAGTQGVAACKKACYDAHPQGLALYAPYHACVQVECGSPLVCADFSNPACGTCTVAQCQDAFVACVSAPQCYALSQCTSTCGLTTACIDSCDSTYPQALAAEGAVSQCLTARCASPCGN